MNKENYKLNLENIIQISENEHKIIDRLKIKFKTAFRFNSSSVELRQQINLWILLFCAYFLITYSSIFYQWFKSGLLGINLYLLFIFLAICLLAICLYNCIKDIYICKRYKNDIKNIMKTHEFEQILNIEMYKNFLFNLFEFEFKNLPYNEYESLKKHFNENYLKALNNPKLIDEVNLINIVFEHYKKECSIEFDDKYVAFVKNKKIKLDFLKVVCPYIFDNINDESTQQTIIKGIGFFDLFHSKANKQLNILNTLHSILNRCGFDSTQNTIMIESDKTINIGLHCIKEIENTIHFINNEKQRYSQKIITDDVWRTIKHKQDSSEIQIIYEHYLDRLNKKMSEFNNQIIPRIQKILLKKFQ